MSAVRERGQALVLFVLMALVMVGSVAIVTDISWLWYGQQRMQRAADAAALAGAIYLPGNPTPAYSTARAEAAKNGFTNGAGGVPVTPLQDITNRRRLRSPSRAGQRLLRPGPGHHQLRHQASLQGRVRAAGAHGQPPGLLRRGRLPGHGTRTPSTKQYGLHRLAHPDGTAEQRLDHTPERRPDDQQRLCTICTPDERLRTAVEHVRLDGDHQPDAAGRHQPGAHARLRDRRRPSRASSSRSRRSYRQRFHQSVARCQLQAELSWNAGTNMETPVVTFTPTLTTASIQTLTLGTSTSTAAGDRTSGHVDSSQPVGAPDMVEASRSAVPAALRKVSVDTIGVEPTWSMDTTTTTYTYTDLDPDRHVAHRRRTAQQGVLGRHHHQRRQPQQW